MASPQHDDPIQFRGQDLAQAERRARGNSSPADSNMASQGVRPRKRVDWQLPADDDSPEDTPGSRPVNIHDPAQSITDNDASQQAPPPPQHTLLAEEQEDELRRELHRMFSNQPPQNHGQDLPPPPPPSVPRISVPSGEPSIPLRPRPVLRSGPATPQRAPSPPSEDLESGIINREGKHRSASVAREKADQLSKTLDQEEPHSTRGFLSRLMHSGKHKRAHSDDKLPLPLYHDGGESIASGQVTPDEADDLDYVPKPSKYRAMGLTAQMLLSGISPGTSRRNSLDDSGNTTPGSATPPASPPSGATGRYRDSPRQSISGMGKFLHVPGSGDSRPASSDGRLGEQQKPSGDQQKKRPSFGRFNSSEGFESRPLSASHGRNGSSASLFDNFSKFANIKSVQKTPSQKQKARKQVDISIKKHVQETRMRQRYLLKLCKALMEYGAPTHRLEDYMKMSARVLETEAQFLYMPGCMIISFDDTRTHTTEVKLVRSAQGVDLGKLKDVHNVYKDVVHDNVGVEQATERLNEIINKPKKFRVWFLVLMHGLASATVGPFAFQARWIDIPIAFFLGCLVGFLRLVWAAKSDLYSAIFEVTSVILTSFISRAFGSIFSDKDGRRLFCFSALTQSSIALILPGYIILCGALELQSHSILAGSVRVFYAIVYSLFIGFGLTVGTVVYGAIDQNAVSSASCENPLSTNWNFLFVFLYTITLMVINQAKLQQMPVMMIISLTGYVVSFFSGQRFQGNSAVSSGLAALAVSVMANGYSRAGGRIDPIIRRQFHKYFERRPSEAQQSVEVSWWRKQLSLLPYRMKSSESGDGIELKDVEKQQESSGDATPEEGPSSDRGRQGSTTSTATLGGLGEDPDSLSDGAATPPREGEQGKKVNYVLAAAAMLPAIFVLVPSGLSVSGSLVQGIQTADALVSSSSTQPAGATATASATTAPSSGTTPASEAGSISNGVALNVGYSVIQIAIGLTVGLFVGTLLVYPFGKGGRGSKSRSGLFTF